MTSTVTSPPGPTGRPLLGSLLEFRADPTRFLTGLARTYGDVSRFWVLRRPIYLFNHPDLIRDVFVTQSHRFHKGVGLERAKRLLGEGLLTSEGEAHKRQRLLVQPAFHKQRIAAYAEAMIDCAEGTASRWRDGETVDMAEEMHRLTLAIVGKTLFGADVESEANAVGSALKNAFEGANPGQLHMPAWLDRLPSKRRRRFDQARATLDGLIFRMIAERRASGEDRGDLLSMLLAARDAEGDGRGMTDAQVRDEAMTLFLAGHETTANALTWTWYLLSQHPEVAARLESEITSVLGDRTPSFEDVPKLAYTRMVLTESMRCFPPAWVVGRRAIEPVTVGGHTLAPGTLVLVSQWVMHHDPRYYPDPERFDPERWSPEASEGRPKFAYFPFGGGPRLCIGEQFAWTEGVLLLAILFRRWRASLVPGHPVAMRPLIVLRPKHGMQMVLAAR